MSLSGQYLEELSRRYKKQVEELQLSFSKTLMNIEEQNRQNTERKQELVEQNAKLRNDLEILAERIFSWSNILVCCTCFTCIQLVIFYVILRIWGQSHGTLPRSASTDIQAMLANMDTAPRRRKTGNIEIRYRRKSAEEKRERTLSETSQQQRRPSTEALHITGTYAELLITDNSGNENDTSLNDFQINGHETSRKRPTKNTSRDASNDCVRIEEIYDEASNDYEFYGPNNELPNTELNGADRESNTTVESSLESSSPQQKKLSKSSRQRHKMRRISSPAFLRSTFSNGNGGTASAAAKSTGWEWYHRRSLQSSQVSKNKQKAKSESPPTLQQNGAQPRSKGQERQNSSTASSIDSAAEMERKPSGSFKRLLKKLF